MNTAVFDEQRREEGEHSRVDKRREPGERQCAPDLDRYTPSPGSWPCTKSGKRQAASGDDDGDGNGNSCGNDKRQRQRQAGAAAAAGIGKRTWKSVKRWTFCQRIPAYRPWNSDGTRSRHCRNSSSAVRGELW